MLLFILIAMAINNQPVNKTVAGLPTSLSIETTIVVTTQAPTKTNTGTAPSPTQIPEADTPQSTPLVYVVQSGDTCSKIAQQFGTSTTKIIAQNHLDANCSILSGSRLLLVDVSQTPEPSTTFTLTATLDEWAAGEINISPLDGMEMVYVPAGPFLMGASMDEPFATNNEKPQSWIYLDAFWIDRTEVTNAMYAGCVAANHCPPVSQTRSKTRFGYFNDPAYANYPVVNVSWQNAQSYCAWAGRRLPSEAEWEKAARGEDGRLYPWGNERPFSSLLNYDNKIGDTTPVGSFPEGASPYGVLDLAGNVREWVSDWYGNNYYTIMPVINPSGPADGEYRILRGGSWFSSEGAVRTAARLWNYPELVSDSNGFRCVDTP
jgi:formylglycine-generating enzyme required for sulfatase activity